MSYNNKVTHFHWITFALTMGIIGAFILLSEMSFLFIACSEKCDITWQVDANHFQGAYWKVTSQALASIIFSIVLLLIAAFMIIFRYRKNDITNQQLKLLAEAKEHSLKIVGHELRTPLNGIVGMAEMLTSDSHLNPTQRKHVKVLHSSAHHMLLMVNNILSHNEFDHTKGLLPKPKPTEIFDVLEEVTNILELMAFSKKINTTITFNCPHETLLIDAGLIRQILLNVGGNAVKFTPSGTVDIHTEFTEGMLRFKIKDTGIGIDPTDQDKIFLEYTQIDNSKLSRRHEGTGLGLSITKKIVDQLQGKIWFHSELNKGTVFYILIPADIYSPEPTLSS